MKPTKITIHKINNPKSNLLAFVEVEFDQTLVVKDLKIINGANGLFVGMPSKPSGKNDGKYFNTAYIVGSEKENTPGRDYSDKLQAAILKKWNESTSATNDFDNQTGFPGDDVPF